MPDSRCRSTSAPSNRMEANFGRPWEEAPLNGGKKCILHLNYLTFDHFGHREGGIGIIGEIMTSAGVLLAQLWCSFA